eukprot:IDg11760t1
MEQAKKVIEESAVSNEAYEIRSGDILSYQNRFVELFRSVPNFTSYHQFLFERKHPGVVKVRGGLEEDWKAFDIVAAPPAITVAELFPTESNVNKTSASGAPLPTLKRHFNCLRDSLAREYGDGVADVKRRDVDDKIRHLIPDDFKDSVGPEPTATETRAEFLRRYKQDKIKKADEE